MLQESCDSNSPSPEPAAMAVDNTPMALDQHVPPPQQQSMFSVNGHSSNQSLPGTPTHNRSSPNSPDPIATIDSAKAAVNAAHINGTSKKNSCIKCQAFYCRRCSTGRVEGYCHLKDTEPYVTRTNLIYVSRPSPYRAVNTQLYKPVS